MKIVLVIDQFDDANNGTTISARRFATALKEHGNEVRVIATGLQVRGAPDAVFPHCGAPDHQPGNASGHSQ